MPLLGQRPQEGLRVGDVDEISLNKTKRRVSPRGNGGPQEGGSTGRPSGLARSPQDPEEARPYQTAGRLGLGDQSCARPPLTSGSGRSEAIAQRSRAGPGQRPLTQLPRTWQEQEVGRRDNLRAL